MSAVTTRLATWRQVGLRPAGAGTAAGILAAQTKAQVRLFWRSTAISLTSLLMPIMLFVFFVLPRAGEPMTGSVTVGAYLLAAIGAYAVSSVMVFNFGVAVAVERGQGTDLLMRVVPLPTWIYLSARVVAALVFGLLAMALLFGVAIGPGGIVLAPGAWTALGLRLLVGAVPFIGFGFAIAYLASPSAAPAIANLCFIGLAFASGMFVPLDQMPGFVGSIAPWLPTYHFAQLAWGAVGGATEDGLTSLAWLAGYGVLFFGLAGWGYRRETGRRFA